MNRTDPFKRSPQKGDSKVRGIARVRFGGLARSSIAVMAWSVARLGAQLAWVLLLARCLGASNYGTFSGVASLAIAMSGFVGVGLSLKMYQDTARDLSIFSSRWRQAFQAFIVSGVCLAAIYFVIARIFFPAVDWCLLLAIAVSELTLAPLVALVGNAYAAHGQMGRAASVPVQLSFARLLGVFALLSVSHVTSIEIYGWLHMLATGLAAGFIWRTCTRRLDIQPSQEKLRWSVLKEGLGFSAVQASALALSTLDKSFALRWGGDLIAGRYVAAYRFVSVAVLPVDSLMIAVMPQLFRAGIKRDRTSIPLILLLALSTGGYGLVMGGLVWYSANLVPWLLGGSFSGAENAVRLLAWYVPLYCLRALGANVLLTFGWKTWRFLFEMAALTCMLVIAAWRIPSSGLSGAVSALLAAEVLLGTLVWVRVLYTLLTGRSTLAHDG